MKNAKMKNQTALAKALGLTPRRVRQLVRDYLLPEPDSEGLFDCEKAERWYALYVDGDEADWALFQSEMIDGAHKCERLLERLEAKDAGDADIGAAGKAVGEVFDALRFQLAARCKSGSAYPLLVRLLNAEEGKAFSPIIAKVEQLHGRIDWSR